MPWHQHTLTLPSRPRGFHLITHLVERAVPELVEADFRTTADDMEWWG